MTNGPSTADAVERQVAAYNARDIEAFVTCHADDVVIEGPDGVISMRGRDEVRTAYGSLFGRSPGLHAEIASRIRVGRWVIDEEIVTGHPAGDLHAVAIYHLDDTGLIDHVRLLV
jgi:hypothetical protein